MDKRILFGLGNVGAKYQGTRHNIGFELLERLARDLSNRQAIQWTDSSSSRLKSRLLSSKEYVLVFPQTYMNRSGEALRAACDWFKLRDYGQILVLYDDVSLPLGRLRWVHQGGAGGHHGIESIVQHLQGFQGFPRLKFGVGPDPGGEERSSFVLSRFDNLDLLEESCRVALASLREYLQGVPLAELMNRFNGVDLRPAPPTITPKEPSPSAE